MLSEKSSFRIFGVTIIINSLFLFTSELLLNKDPIIGISPRIGILDVATLSSSLITPVNTSVLSFFTLIEPVSNFLTLNVLCIPQPEISTVLVTEEIAGLKEKVTKPLSSILSTLAPKVMPEVPSVPVHVVTPESVVVLENFVMTV